MLLFILGLFLGAAAGVLVSGLCAGSAIDGLLEELDCERAKR